ncbi:MAG: hypothetical protein R8N23_01130 [Reichenbachiella sp.]|uniref:hypothetical protein n=1 Tax=Reichenbachiella sp. TaxID=2184521 RepID=UPI0029671380|nr:hypothetical protein [Reichenbachiella sp.]MDW3208439.1 hypothetical protein [Reichenbachiella sp.]
MKKLLLSLSIIALFVFDAQSQSTPSYKVITVIESIVPGGLGRSRLIDGQTEINIDDFTTERTDGKKSSQSDVSRADAKVDRFEESKLLNFYSLTGINFQNVASNDALITSKLNELTEEGWELAFVTSGVESDAGAKDGKGLFITRFIFKKP